MAPRTSKPAKPARFAIAIMAAGKGTRLKSRYPKVLHRVGGLPLLEHVIRAATQVVPPADVFAIIGHEAEMVEAAVRHTTVRFLYQREQKGTGHALMMARDALRGYDAVLVLSGDTPLIRPATIVQLREFHLTRGAAMTVLTAAPADPGAFGRVLRRGRSDQVTAIVEFKALTAAQRKVREVNSGTYAFDVSALYGFIDRLTTGNAHHEYYLTDMAAILVKARKPVLALCSPHPEEVLGANTREEMAQLDATLRMKKCRELMRDGATIFRPETCVIDQDVSVGPDSVIEPFVQLLGTTRVGSECVLRSYSVIADSELADRVTVLPGCMLEGARVASGAQIGPYGRLRPGSDIGEDARVGNFVEVKKTRMGKGAKANHLTYLGDAEIGPGVNVGAGTITCNYDGVHKHGTVIEEGAFIGSDSTLVAPVRVGRGAYVGAASCITEDVPADALAIARGKQVNKEGWARARRLAREAAKK